MRIEDLVGTWRAGGQRILNPDGTEKSAKGPEAPGHLIYTPQGQMMVLSTDPRGIALGEPARLTMSEKAKAADACVAYFGRYELRGDDVLHHIENALFPGWVGKTRVRHASIAGARMTFVTDPDPSGCVTHIFWDKL